MILSWWSVGEVWTGERGGLGWLLTRSSGRIAELQIQMVPEMSAGEEWRMGGVV